MQDPLSISIETKGLETTFPLLPEGDYLFQVTESAPQVNKAQSGYNWNLKLALSEPATAADGRPVNVNTPVFMQIALQPSEEAKDPLGFKRGIADATDAIFNTTKEDRPDFNKDLWEGAVGKMVKAHIYIDEYPKGSGNFSNKVRRLKKNA